MRANEDVLKWGIERRIAFLDSCLHWVGQVNRSDLMKFFGISLPQASSDLSRYAELAPGNLVYDRSRKAYLRGADFRPVIETPKATEILMALAGGLRGGDGPRAPWTEGLLVERSMPRLNRTIDEDVLTSLIAAVRTKRSIRICYQSFSNPIPSDRSILPYAFVSDGERWHLRAFCERNLDFRDFVVSRISKCILEDKRSVDPDLDYEWTTMVTMRLAPNPRLDRQVRRMLEREYGMHRGVTMVETRASNIFYVMKQMFLDYDPEPTSPVRQPLVIENRDEVEQARVDARSRSKLALQELKVGARTA